MGAGGSSNNLSTALGSAAVLDELKRPLDAADLADGDAPAAKAEVRRLRATLHGLEASCRAAIAHDAAWASLPAELRARVDRAFAAVDKDGSSRISIEELRALFDSDARAVFSTMEAHTDGGVTLAEWRHFYAKSGADGAERALEMCELLMPQWMAKLVEARPPRPRPPAPPTPTARSPRCARARATRSRPPTRTRAARSRSTSCARSSARTRARWRRAAVEVSTVRSSLGASAAAAAVARAVARARASRAPPIAADPR